MSPSPCETAIFDCEASHVGGETPHMNWETSHMECETSWGTEFTPDQPQRPVGEIRNSVNHPKRGHYMTEI